MTIIALGALAAVGALLRWQTSATLPRPLGTLGVNIVGAFVLGVLLDSTGGSDVSVGVGLLGTLSTFSTLVDDLAVLWVERRLHAVIYGVATLILGVGAAWLGLQLN